MSYIDSQVAKRRLDSARALDEAAIFEGNTQKPFGIQSVTLDLSSEKLETSPYKINFPFKAIYIQDTTDSNVGISFKPNTQDSFQSPIILGQNDCLNFDEPLSGGNFFWDAQASKTITIVFLVNGEIRSGKLVSVTSGGLVISEGTSFSTSVVTLVGATPTVVASSDSTRTVSTIQNNSAAPIWVGGSSVSSTGANLGIQVGIGQSIQWKNTAALYAYSAAGGDVLVMNEVQ